MSTCSVSLPFHGATGEQQDAQNAKELPIGSPSWVGPGGFHDQPAAGELPDDFKYDVSVSESFTELRNTFIRKVYTILSCQIAMTWFAGGVISWFPEAVFWVQIHDWSFCVPFFGAFISFGLLYWKRHSPPWNFILLPAFTSMEAFTLGVVVASYDSMMVLQALLITFGIILFIPRSALGLFRMCGFLFGNLIPYLMMLVVALSIRCRQASLDDTVTSIEELIHRKIYPS